MESIKLPESELSDMRQFYQEELDKTLKRLNHIKSVLEQLGEQSIQINISGNEAAAKAQPTKAKTAAAARVRKGKRGPKPFWEDLIVKRLTQLDKPMTYDELTDDLIISTGRSMEKRDAIRQAIVNVVFRLRKEKRKLETITNGSREAYVVLKRWFEEDGKLKTPYQLRLAAEAESRKAAVVKVEKPKGKRGRPAKNVAAPTLKAVAAPKAPKAKAPAKVKAEKAPAKAKAPVKVAEKVKAVAKPAAKATPKATPKAKPEAKAATAKPAVKAAPKAKPAAKAVKPAVKAVKAVAKAATKAKPAAKAAAKPVVKKAVAPVAAKAPKAAKPAGKAAPKKDAKVKASK